MPAVDPRPTILVVDSNHRNYELLGSYLHREGFGSVHAADLESFDRALHDSGGIQLALVTPAGFDRRIWERCERLRAREIPFLVLSPRQAGGIRQEGLAHGARAVMFKPLIVRELLAIVRTLLEEQGE